MNASNSLNVEAVALDTFEGIGGALGIFYASGVVAKIEFAEITL